VRSLTRQLDARLAAFKVLFAVETKGALSSGSLAEIEPKLSERDRGLCHEIVLGTLRRQLELDRIIDKLVAGKRLDMEVRIVLRLGLYQLRHLDRIPAHSAVNESVKLIRQLKRSSAAGLVNAILRRYERERTSPQPDDAIDRIVLETSHPRELIERWTANFGRETAAAIARANNEKPHLTFRAANRAVAADRQLIEKYQRVEGVQGAAIAVRYDALLNRLADEGKIYFQDAGSQLVANAISLRDGGRFLDVCASPGSKCTAIAIRFPRHAIVAGDRSQRRTELLKNAAVSQRCRNIDIVRYDAERPLPFAAASFDVVLVDAPCTGTGTIRHNPELRYRITTDEIVRHSLRQLRILQNSSQLVKENGLLIYSTCSIEPEENEGVAAEFLSNSREMQAVTLDIDARFRCDDGFYRTRPDRDDMDGFFIAGFQRSKIIAEQVFS